MQQYPKVRVYTKTFGSLRSTMEGSSLRSFIKLLVEQGDKVVGCHMVGDDAPEIIQVGLTSPWERSPEVCFGQKVRH